MAETKEMNPLITTTELEELEKLRAKANIGPWYEDHSHVSSDSDIICDYVVAKENRAYIAALNPLTLRRILNTMDEMRKVIEFYGSADNWMTHGYDDEPGIITFKDIENIGGIEVGGKRAREFMAKFEGNEPM